MKCFWPFLVNKKRAASADTTKTFLSHKHNENFLLSTQRLYLLDISSWPGFKALKSIDGLKMRRRPEDLQHRLTKRRGSQITLSDLQESHYAKQSRILEFHGALFIICSATDSTSVQTPYCSAFWRPWLRSSYQVVNWCRQNIQTDEFFLSRIFCYDEHIYHVDGIVNKRKAKVWGTESLHGRKEKGRDTEKWLYGAQCRSIKTQIVTTSTILSVMVTVTSAYWYRITLKKLSEEKLLR